MTDQTTELTPWEDGRISPRDLMGLSPAQMTSDVADHLRSLLESTGDLAASPEVAKDIKRLLGALSPEPDLLFLGTIAPRPADFQYPGRPGALARESVKRLKKSELVFPPPGRVLDAVADLLGGGGRSGDEIFRMQLHVASFMRRVNIPAHGFIVSRILMHIVRAADKSATAKSREGVARQLTDLGADLGYWAPDGGTVSTDDGVYMGTRVPSFSGAQV